MLYFIAFVLAAAVGFYAYSKLREELAKLEVEDQKAAKTATAKVKKKGEGVETLKKDPKTGVYRIDED